MNPFPLTLLASLVSTALLAAAEPTETRTWTATGGTTVKGRVLAVSGGKARLERSDGRFVEVPLSAFIESDRDLLEAHFGGADTGVTDSGADAGVTDSGGSPATGLPHPQGEVTGPIEAGGGSTYMVYLATSLKEGRDAPLLFYSNAVGGRKDRLEVLKDAAELGGWILAISMESSNKLGYDKSTMACEAAVDHLLETLPIDSGRVYFTGGSGGGAQAFKNASVMEAAGVMTYVTYIAAQGTPDAEDYFIIAGGCDYNRYCTAESRKELGRKATLRAHPGGHGHPPTWMLEDGMIWMNGRYLSRHRSKYEDVALDYEAAVIRWMEDLSGKEPHRVYATTRFLKDEYGIEGGNAGAVDALIRKLGSDEKNVRYFEGLAAIDEFAAKELSKHAVKGNTPKGHTAPKIVSAATELADGFAGTPVIEDTFRAMAGPTK